MTSAERALRHGELKLLRGMKKTHKEEDSRKRKVLKKDMWEIEDNLDAEDDSVDIRDIDFRMRHNQRQVKVKTIHFTLYNQNIELTKNFILATIKRIYCN